MCKGWGFFDDRWTEKTKRKKRVKKGTEKEHWVLYSKSDSFGQKKSLHKEEEWDKLLKSFYKIKKGERRFKPQS